MKKLIASLSTLLMGVVFFSCETQPNQAHMNSNPEEAHHHISELKLDNGKRWSTHPRITKGINIMKEILDSFSEKDDIKAYPMLKEELETEFHSIIKYCTMDGEAHDQLHNYLLPMNKILDGLSSPDLKVCQDHLNAMDKHLAEYSNYFE
jgi:hypothetical protein